MATILRLAKHAQKISLFSSAKCISSCKNCVRIDRVLVKKYEIVSNSVRSLATQNLQHSSTVDLDNQRIDNTLNKLDIIARKSGRIARKDVEDLFNEIKNSGKATSNQCLLALRCCGSLLPDEHLSTRTELVTKIWNTLESLGCKLDVSHYNVLLKVYLENEHTFDPTEFLANMESKGITPNRVTFQRLVAYYCQKGDINGAGKILEYMKQQELPINENVFNALITGHARANDMESAEGILEVMRSAKLEPTSDTYATLLCAYAEKGNLEKVKMLFEEADKREIFFLDIQYLELIYTLAKFGHFTYIDEVIKKLRKFAGFNQDAISVILRLIICGQDDVAYKLMCHMPQATTPDGKVAAAGNFLIRQLVREERPIDKILKICDEMRSSGLNDGALQKATEMALVNGKIDHALAFIKAMKEKDLPVRAHYFWPILSKLKNSKADESRIYEIVDKMMEYGSPANYSTFLEYIFPAVDITDFKTMTMKFKDMGYTVGVVASPLVEYFVSMGKLNAAAAVVEEYFIRLNLNSLLRPLATACKKNNDAPSLIIILKRMKENADKNAEAKSDLVGNFLVDYCRVVDRNVAKIGDMAQLLLNNHFKISGHMKDVIVNFLHLPKTDNLSELLTKLVSNSEEFVSGDSEQTGFVQQREMSIEDLETQLAELKNKNMNTKGILRRLLLQYCRAKNLKRVEEIKAELDSQDFIFTAAMIAQMIDLYVNCNNLDQARTLFDQLIATQPDFQLDDQKTLNYAALLVKEDQFDEALKFLNEQQVNHTSSKNENFAWRLLNSATDKGNISLTENIFDVLMKRKLCEPTNIVLGPLVKGYIMNNDIAGAISKFEECCKTYRCTPWRNQLFALLIKSDDADRLQKVMDLNSEIHGEMNTLYDLAFTFMDCGRLREAKKILESSGLRARHARLDSMCERLIEDDRINDLEELVNITRDLFDVDRDRMYFYLLKAYRKEKNYSKALGVWTTMQEENIFPSDRTLNYLADILKENQQPVPFAVPSSQSTQNETENSPIIEALREEKLDEALDIKRRIESTGGKLKLNETSILIENLIQKERLLEAVNIVDNMIDNKTFPPIRIIRFLLLRLAAGGDVDGVRNFEEKLTTEAKRSVQFNNVLMHAYVNSGRHMEILELLEKDATGPKLYSPGGAIFDLLNKHPYLIERVEKLAFDYSKQNVHGLLNMIWTHYFCKEQYEKAETILKSTTHFTQQLTYRRVIEQAESTNNDEMLKRLCDVVKSSSLTEPSIARVYTSLLEVQCANKKFDEAFTAYSEAKEKNIQHLIHQTTLAKLRAGLQAMGKDVSSIAVDSSSRQSQENSSSSSSSDSDSDKDDKKVKQ